MSFLRGDVNRILKKLKSGNNAILQELYQVTANHLKVIAYQYIVNKNDWEDVLMETYIRVQKYIQTFNDEKDGYNWLCRIVENIARDMNRKTSREIPSEERYLTFYVDDSMLESFKDDELLRALSVRTSLEQELIYFKFYRGLTYKEIAEVVGCKVSEVKLHIKTALSQIRKDWR
ncbi:MAG: RNA polymerase sigma factor [Clostridia bacterium]|nr:RNA polymerase sigma factor [Clostridia bacterium]